MTISHRDVINNYAKQSLPVSTSRRNKILSVSTGVEMTVILKCVHLHAGNMPTACLYREHGEWQLHTTIEWAASPSHSTSALTRTCTRPWSKFHHVARAYESHTSISLCHKLTFVYTYPFVRVTIIFCVIVMRFHIRNNISRTLS